MSKQSTNPSCLKLRYNIFPPKMNPTENPQLNSTFTSGAYYSYRNSLNWLIVDYSCSQPSKKVTQETILRAIAPRYLLGAYKIAHVPQDAEILISDFDVATRIIEAARSGDEDSNHIPPSIDLADKDLGESLTRQSKSLRYQFTGLPTEAPLRMELKMWIEGETHPDGDKIPRRVLFHLPYSAVSNPTSNGQPEKLWRDIPGSGTSKTLSTSTSSQSFS